MMLHDVVVFVAGFGCGAMWLGVAFFYGHRLRRCQPPDGPEPVGDAARGLSRPEAGPAGHVAPKLSPRSAALN
jgi:hypothetical protein